MENVIRSSLPPEQLLGTFDLKGSRSDRLVKGIEVGQATTMKDLNLIDLNSKHAWL